MALRLLLAARKSRKSDDVTTQYERQDGRAKGWAEREGHTIVGITRDVKSGTSAPWDRKELKPWMTEARQLEFYDAILISDTDRLSRGTDEDFHWIENWAYRNHKSIIVADGPWFPPREGPMSESDRYQWVAQKRAARTYWEAVRDKHADTKRIIEANGAATGRPAFGYMMAGTKLHKRFEFHPVNGPIAREAFQRIADGRTARSVANWLAEVTGRKWRVTGVIMMIKRRAYLGTSGSHQYEPLIPEELWNAANAALEARSFKQKDRGGRAGKHAYSGVIYCECGAVRYHNQPPRSPRPKYVCSKGRNGSSGDTCDFPAIPFDPANEAVNAEMLDDHTPEWVMVTTGGDHARQAELQALRERMKSAMARSEMAEVSRLAAEYAAVEARPSNPIVTKPRRTGRTISEAWEKGTLADQRSMLRNVHVTIKAGPDGIRAVVDDLSD